MISSIKRNEPSHEHITGGFVLLMQYSGMVRFRFSRAEEKGNAPDARKCDEGVDNACNQGILTAADPRDEVELEKSDAAPVECADDNEYQGESVKYHNQIPFGVIGQSLPDIIFPEKLCFMNFL